MDRLILADVREGLTQLDDCSVDAIVTDPPYELGFMGKAWDASGIANNVDMWKQALRVLKPGGHLLAFSGSRTYHRMVCAIEDAGFEVRDQIMWLYGSGFPKSRNISNDMDDGSAWEGWGTALKPAHEPIVVARKPLIGTVAANVLAHGTGALNIDACRVVSDESIAIKRSNNHGAQGGSNGWGADRENQDGGDWTVRQNDAGRWPANVIHDGLTEEWARFFYCAKASKKDRDEGLDEFEKKRVLVGAERHKINPTTGKPVVDVPRANIHPTVKPTDLMAYLVRLVTPPGGVVLDPFMGSGSTGKACAREGFDFIGIDMTPEYVEIARARIAAERAAQVKPVVAQPDLFCA